MPVLQFKWKSRDVLKYSLDLTLAESQDDEGIEVELTVVVKVGQDGKFTTETRVNHRSGPVKLPACLTEPGTYQVGQNHPLFLPHLAAQEVEVGSLWTVQQGDLQVFYEWTSLEQGVAEIISRRVCSQTHSETECLYEFDVKQGRVTLAQTVTEVTPPNGPKQRQICEYELLED